MKRAGLRPYWRLDRLMYQRRAGQSSTVLDSLYQQRQPQWPARGLVRGLAQLGGRREPLPDSLQTAQLVPQRPWRCQRLPRHSQSPPPNSLRPSRPVPLLGRPLRRAPRGAPANLASGS